MFDRLILMIEDATLAAFPKGSAQGSPESKSPLGAKTRERSYLLMGFSFSTMFYYLKAHHSAQELNIASLRRTFHFDVSSGETHQIPPIAKWALVDQTKCDKQLNVVPLGLFGKRHLAGRLPRHPLL